MWISQESFEIFSLRSVKQITLYRLNNVIGTLRLFTFQNVIVLLHCARGWIISLRFFFFCSFFCFKIWMIHYDDAIKFNVDLSTSTTFRSNKISQWSSYCQNNMSTHETEFHLDNVLARLLKGKIALYRRTKAVSS